MYTVAATNEWVSWFMVMYSSLLGDFSLVNFNGHQMELQALFFFIGASYISIILTLNLFIAILSDIFEMVTEQKIVYGRQTKLRLMGDYAGNFTKGESKET